MLREGEGWRRGETWSSKVNPDGPIDPDAIKIRRISPADLKNAPQICRRSAERLRPTRYKSPRKLQDARFCL